VRNSDYGQKKVADPKQCRKKELLGMYRASTFNQTKKDFELGQRGAHLMISDPSVLGGPISTTRKGEAAVGE